MRPDPSWLRVTMREQGAPLAVLILLCSLHAVAVWLSMGGQSGLMNEWPLLQYDHGIHYSHGLVSRDYLRETGFTAGYDPSYMAGFPMSVIAGTSFTLVNVTMFLFSGGSPAVVYKLTVLAAVVASPLLMTWAGVLFGLTLRGVAWSTALYLIYFWTDFPIYYSILGMVTFSLVIPTGLIALALLTNYLERGGWRLWVYAALACSWTFFIHLTSPLTVGVAGLLAYGVATLRGWEGKQAFPWSRHLGFWGLAPVILAVNAFWWLPGVWLRTTAGETSFKFAHDEPLFRRLGEIFWKEAEIEPVLIGLGVLGLVLLAAARSVAASGLAGMIAAGLGWGYLAGPFRSLDGLQPGRQTYAFYSGLCVAAGFGLGELLPGLRSLRPKRLDRWVALAIVLAGVRIFGPSLTSKIKLYALGPIPALSSQPHPVLLELLKDLHTYVKPGERLMYEETGLAIRGLSDPFNDRHLSPVLPSMTGVEVLGGPYLHTPLKTNFTQFGEEKLFGTKNWDRAQFVRYARLYRPTAIVCWTPKAQKFCQNNPDLIQILMVNSVLLLGRVIGFEGAAIRGQAQVEAGPNRLVVRDMVADKDGLVVLRYHMTPCLVADPPLPLEPVYLEEDPVPFLGIRPNQPGPVTIRMAFPPRSGWLSSPTEGK